MFLFLVNPSGLHTLGVYMGTSLIGKRIPLGPYRRPVSRVLGWT
jgi:hypothetical protein